MRQILNTLYVMTPNACVHLENDILRIEVERENKIQVPLHDISSVVCFGDGMISSDAMHRCADDGCAVVLLDRNGRFKARVEGPGGGDIHLRQAQLRLAGNTDFVLDTAKSMIAGKLHNARQVLQRGARDVADAGDSAKLAAGAKSLSASLSNLPMAQDLPTLHGIETDAARNYFVCLNFMLRADVRAAFRLDESMRRPPRERLPAAVARVALPASLTSNALLSFLYAMLMNDCRSALESVGLDPQLGYVHTRHPGRAALALDLMEELRAVMADRLALSLINGAQVTRKDFVKRPSGALVLNDAGRKTVAAAYQEFKQEEIIHPVIESKMPAGLLPHLQARFIAHAVRGEMQGYVPFLMK